MYTPVHSGKASTWALSAFLLQGKEVVSWAWNLPSRLDWLIKEPQISDYLWLLAPVIRCVLLWLPLKINKTKPTWSSNAGSHACQTSTFLAEPSPSFQTIAFCFRLENILRIVTFNHSLDLGPVHLYRHLSTRTGKGKFITCFLSEILWLPLSYTWHIWIYVQQGLAADLRESTLMSPLGLSPSLRHRIGVEGVENHLCLTLSQ